MKRFCLRTSLLASAFFAVSAAFGQTLSPAWIKTAVQGVAPAKYSADGSIFVTNTGAFRASDGRQIASFISSLVEPKPDGSGAIVYAESPTYGVYNLYDVNFATGSTLLSETLQINALAVSPNGLKLVVSIYGPVSTLITYNLHNFSQIKAFTSPYTTAPVLKFRSDSTTFVSSGPILWNLNGTKVRQNPATNFPFALSANGNTIYQWMNASGKLQAIDASTNTVLWTKVLTDATANSPIGTSSDGTRVLVNLAGSVLKSLNATTGAPGAETPLRGDRQFIDSSPVSGQILVFGHDAAGNMGLDQQAYDTTADQVGSPLRVNQPVFSYRNLQRFKVGTVAEFAYYDHHTISTVRNNTGNVLDTFVADSASFAFSRDGSQLASVKKVGNAFTLQIVDVPTHTLLAKSSLPSEPLSISSSNKNRFLVRIGSQLRIYAYGSTTGSAKLLNTLTAPSNFGGQSELSPDGLTVSLHLTSPAVVRLVNAANGATVASVSTAENGADAYQRHLFLSDGRLAVHEMYQDQGSGYDRQAVKIYAKESDTELVNVVNDLQETYSNHGADVSLDGKSVAFVCTPRGLSSAFNASTVKVFSGTTGAPVKTYDRPYGYGDLFDLMFSADGKYLNVNLGGALLSVKY